jgi:hypothetical protein
MPRTEHSRFRQTHDFVPDFAAMVSIVAHEPKSYDSYRALLRGYHELVHVTIETHHCREDYAPVATS